MSDWKVPVSMVDQAKEMTRLQADNEALRARVAELERVIPGQIIKAHQRAEVCWDSFNHLDAALGSPMVRKFVLRKQAEAVDEAVIHVNNLYGHDGTRFTDFSDYAQRLRTQAAAIERQSEGGE